MEATTEKASASQTIINLPGTALLRVVLGKVEFSVAFTDGATTTVVSGNASVPSGRTHAATGTVGSDGVIRLYLNGVFIAAAGAAGRTPVAPTGDFHVGIQGDDTIPFLGEIARVAFYDTTFSATVHANPYWRALSEPWSHITNVGYRARFLFEEFRHRKDNAGATVAGTHPGIPASWYLIDDPSDVAPAPMMPKGRSMLGYLQSLEATESALLKVKNDGRVRLRRRGLVTTPRKPSTIFAPSGAGTVPFRNVQVGRNSNVVTVVNYGRSNAQAGAVTELRSTSGVAAHGEVAHNLPELESSSDALARQAAVDVLNRNAITPPAPTANGLSVRVGSPGVGWDVASFEPGDTFYLDAPFPQYTHGQAYEVLDVRLDGAPSDLVLTLGGVGN